MEDVVFCTSSIKAPNPAAPLPGPELPTWLTQPWGARPQCGQAPFGHVDVCWRFAAPAKRRRSQQGPIFELGSAPAAGSRPCKPYDKAAAASQSSYGFRPFATLSATVAAKQREVRLHRTFAEIDTDNKGYLEEQDLEEFAKRNGLPVAYVPYFMRAVLRSSTAAGKDAMLQTPVQIGFSEFSTFVGSREASLKRAFDIFDVDRNGRLTRNELAAGLANIRIGCPTSRCIYRCNREAVRMLVDSLAPGERKAGIQFAEFRDLFLLLPQTDMLVEYWISAKCPGQLDIGGCVAIRDQPSKGSPWGHLLAGGAAGATSRTATAPLETLRLQAMSGAVSSGNMLVAAQQVVGRDGWRALYRGNLVNVMRSAPQKAIDFLAFDLFKKLLGGQHGTTAASTFLAAGLAGVCSNIMLYPLEVVRSRLTCDIVRRYRNMADAVSQIVRAEGGSALYRGLGPSCAAILPEAAITYGMFDLLKKAYGRVTHQPESSVGVVPALAFGVVSAFMGQLVAYPLETVSRRMQLHARHNPLLLFQEILRQEGPKGLYRGVGAASLRVIPMALVSFGTYEAVRQWLTRLEEKQLEERARHDLAACRSRVSNVTELPAG
ncbi:hypothetical protein WJX72_003076 [[Myrmecia] bisecta]|uniref:EF-hand domain-containing protein n=1 Tax=[Myrmecia] bisecta TaxID=41462 RepID=A0AAW1PP53_9CHLO